MEFEEGAAKADFIGESFYLFTIVFFFPKDLFFENVDLDYLEFEFECL